MLAYVRLRRASIHRCHQSSPDATVSLSNQSLSQTPTDTPTVFSSVCEHVIDAMSGQANATIITTIRRELRRDWEQLDRGCRTYGVTALMFRTAKFVFYIAVLGAMGYLIEAAGVEPFVAMAFAVLLISGPEALETWLTTQGAIQTAPNGGQSPNDDDNG